MPIKSRWWTAYMASQDDTNHDWRLVVAGEVELPLPMRAAVMREIPSPGDNMRSLALEVVPLDQAMGPEVPTWHKVGFLEEKLGGSRYDQVLVFFENEEIADLSVHAKRRVDA